MHSRATTSEGVAMGLLLATGGRPVHVAIVRIQPLIDDVGY